VYLRWREDQADWASPDQPESTGPIFGLEVFRQGALAGDPPAGEFWALLRAGAGPLAALREECHWLLVVVAG